MKPNVFTSPQASQSRLACHACRHISHLCCSSKVVVCTQPGHTQYAGLGKTAHGWLWLDFLPQRGIVERSIAFRPHRFACSTRSFPRNLPSTEEISKWGITQVINYIMANRCMYCYMWSEPSKHQYLVCSLTSTLVQYPTHTHARTHILALSMELWVILPV